MESILLIRSMFGKKIGGQDKLMEWNPGHYQGYRTIEMANRYFTSFITAVSVNESPKPLPSSIDPNGVLTLVSNDGKLIYTENNQVRYLHRKEKPEGGFKLVNYSSYNLHLQVISRYFPINPAKFAIGDIVECQVSFEMLNYRTEHKMFIILRSLALLDDSFSKV